MELKKELYKIEDELKKEIEGVSDYIFKNPELGNEEYKAVEFLIKEHLIDYVAMDMKNSFTNYAFTTGVANINTKNIQTSINLLKRNLIPYEFRTTLVGGHHEEEDIYEMGEMLKGAQVVYLQHFKDVGGCLQQGLSEISKQTAEQYQQILKQFVTNVYLRGY